MSSPSFGRIAPRSFAFVFGVIVSLIGIVFAVVGFSAGSQERELAREGVVTNGTIAEKRLDHVTRHKKNGRTEEQTQYLVRYRFTTQGHMAMEGEQAIGEARWRGLRQDGPIAVRYLEANPFANRVDAEPRNTSVFLLIGGPVAAAGLVLFLVGLRTVRRTLALLRDGMRCTATVTAVDARTVRRRTTHRIHYSYDAPAGGGTHTGKSLALSAQEAKGWKAGDTARIRVDTKDPRVSAWAGERG